MPSLLSLVPIANVVPQRISSLHVASKPSFRSCSVAHQDCYCVRVEVPHPLLNLRLRRALHRLAGAGRVGHQCFRFVPTSIVHTRLLFLALLLELDRVTLAALLSREVEDGFLT
jgi:hypothetical protein